MSPEERAKALITWIKKEIYDNFNPVMSVPKMEGIVELAEHAVKLAESYKELLYDEAYNPEENEDLQAFKATCAQLPDVGGG